MMFQNFRPNPDFMNKMMVMTLVDMMKKEMLYLILVYKNLSQNIVNNGLSQKISDLREENV